MTGGTGRGSSKADLMIYAVIEDKPSTAGIADPSGSGGLCDPNVGNGIEFTSLSDKDSETLRQFIEGVAAQQKSDSSAD
jgi:hypothetical protein